ncbi:protein WHAT'S THIS FACTOR 1, chloroplastic-like [Corylus avellana]|uniref:protein WHAT'S THIS FACTOR 1, chloroplastic-like n=1 Tax=Corylus avellana TaxID=13451 RepID=UPI00286C3AE2|nr:protein WHAT'S THIS FACTOR 1, chloroplastic-like [Corylus avellana]
MALSLPFSSQMDCPISFLNSSFLPRNPSWLHGNINQHYKSSKNFKNLSISISCSSRKIVQSPSLDRHIVKQNKIRFVQKLKTLLLSKPKHYMLLHILSKCRSYLSLSKPRSLLSMIHRYPLIFEVFSVPRPPLPFNATKSYSQLCVRLTPAAAALASQELKLKSAISMTLATKLQKLLMLSSHRRLLLSKLVHLAPDLGLPPNFRSRLCNDHPDKFKTVDTSYGRALELVSWDPHLANPLPSPEVHSHDMIVDRPLKFKQLRLRKGLNLKRHHQDFLINFGEMPAVCPYNTSAGALAKESIEEEKRACAVVREVLGMMIEKRTLIDHLTHFRKEFGLPNKLRGMFVRHPELFYVSLKGQRDSVFLVEGYDEKGALLEKDETSVIKDQLMALVREGNKMRRERRRAMIYSYATGDSNDGDDDDDYEVDHNNDDHDDGLDDLFDYEDSDLDCVVVVGDDESSESLGHMESGLFWTADSASLLNDVDGANMEPW